MKALSKQDIIQKLYGILAMCDGFAEVTHAGGKRQKEMQKYLPHQIACQIMSLQQELEESVIIEPVTEE